MRSIRTRLVAARPALAALALTAILAACGGDATAPEPPAAPAGEPAYAVPAGGPSADDPDMFPVTVTVAGTSVTIASRPERIVSLSPSSTEGLFAIGAGPQVVAADEYSDFPAEAPTTDLSGFSPNLEAIAVHDPDLVVAQYDPGELVAGLEALGVPVLLLPSPATLDDVFLQLEALGTATGNVAAAATTAADLRARLDAVVAALPLLDEPLTYYHELDESLFTVTSSTFVGAVYGLLGLENVADAADPDGESFGYPQLSPEFLIAADPDLVFLADTRCCAVTAEGFAGRDGHAMMSAVRAGRVFELDDDVASRWGPRIIDLVELIGAAVTAVAAAPAG